MQEPIIKKVKKFNEQIKKINEIGDDPGKLQYLGSTIPALTENLPLLLREIEEKLVNLRSKYTDNQRVRQGLMKRDLMLTKLRKSAL